MTTTPSPTPSPTPTPTPSRRTSRAAALLAGALLAPLLLAGCGGSGDDLPACDEVWALGRTVPADYTGCQRGIVLDTTTPDECTDQRRLVAYDDRFFAFLGEPAETMEGEAGEKAYAAADTLCSTPLKQLAAAEARRTDPTITLTTWLRAYANANAAVACRLQTAAYTDDAIARAVARKDVKRKGARCADLVEAVAGSLRKLDLRTLSLTRLDEDATHTRVSVKEPKRPATTYDLTFDEDHWVVDLPAARA